MIETGFGKEFSEPPNVAVSDTRTHCDACQEPLDPSVMHKCHGNQEYEAPVDSSTLITEACPDCKGLAVLFERQDARPKTYTLVCGDCRTFVAAEVPDLTVAIYVWNDVAMRARASGQLGVWPKWHGVLPGDDERANVIQSEPQAGRHPDLTNYKGACPAVHVDGEVCDWCEGTGTVPPTKGDAP